MITIIITVLLSLSSPPVSIQPDNFLIMQTYEHEQLNGAGQ